MSRRTQRSYSGGSRPMIKSAKSAAASGSVRLRSGSTGNRPRGDDEEEDEESSAIQFKANAVPLAVVDPEDIAIVETNPEGQGTNIADDVIFEEEGDERGGWGNKLVSFCLAKILLFLIIRLCKSIT